MGALSIVPAPTNRYTVSIYGQSFRAGCERKREFGEAQGGKTTPPIHINEITFSFRRSTPVTLRQKKSNFNQSNTTMSSRSSYGGYGNANSASYGANGGSSYSYGGASTGSTLRHRVAPQTTTKSYDESDGKDFKPTRAVVEKLDFMFPKVDKDFTVQTKTGGVASLVAYGLIAILCLAEVITWLSQNRTELSRTFVDQSLGKKMQVNLNITFPALACDDLHLDMIDIAGDSQIDVDDTLKKRKLHLDGKLFTKHEIDVEVNLHRDQQVTKERILKEQLPEDYCGPCYGAHETENQCCQTCDEVIVSYSKKRWKTDLLKYTAEQCIREGRDHQEPRKMIKGQGCNLSGYMKVNRVSGNFHVAMGEGIERDGRHIHTYLPEDAANFNASHIIHSLSFGPEDGSEAMNGVTKIVTEDTGTTGFFQYFIKVVPTTYFDEAVPKSLTAEATAVNQEGRSGKSKSIETNRYFFTERFLPLMTELLEDEHYEENSEKAAVKAGPGGVHNHDHHFKQNAVLPGVFFIYEIYPFAVEIRKNSVPFTHLLIRLMATIGGVITLVRWADSFVYERQRNKQLNR